MSLSPPSSPTRLVDVVAEEVGPRLADGDGQGQPHVSESDDAYPHSAESMEPSGPRPGIDSAVMKTLLAPALMGVNVAKHFAWYVSYQVSGQSRV